MKIYLEKNYAGFNDKVNSETLDDYFAQVKKFKDLSKQAKKESYCIYTMKKFLTFFDDNHIQIASKKKEGIDSILISETEIINIPNKKLDALKNSKQLEGIYFNSDSTYQVALIRNKNDFRDYAGVIVESKATEWTKGQVKIELKKINDTLFDCIYYYRDHSPHIIEYTIKDNKLPDDDWIKINSEKNKVANINIPNEFSFASLSDSVSYFKIPTFMGSSYIVIDSLIKNNENALTQKPYLIIDLRNNGGGADYNYSPLMPYIYTNPIISVGVDIYSTPSNIIAWERLLTTFDLPEDSKKSIKRIIKKMKKNLNQFIPIIKDDTTTYDKVYKNPKKIAVLINENCGSTTEQFLLAAKQSKKVILMGTNTSGTLDYSNMREVEFPNLNYSLWYSTTRSRRIPDNAIDKTGIIPDIKLNNNTDWIKFASKYLQNYKN